MRVAALFVLLAMVCSGCLDQGLGSSSRACTVSGPVEQGVRIEIPEPEGFVGYCVELRGGFERALAKVPADGVVWFGLDAPDRYTFSVEVEQPDDKYCQDERRGFFDYNGTGLVEVVAMSFTVCS